MVGETTISITKQTNRMIAAFLDPKAKRRSGEIEVLSRRANRTFLLKAVLLPILQTIFVSLRARVDTLKHRN